MLAVTTVTNFAAGLNQEPLGSAQSMRVAAAAAPALTRVLVKLFERWVSEHAAVTRRFV